MPERVETLIIGGGQAGLALSYWLTQAGREHCVLERGRIAERWHSERWDSLCLLTPNWTMILPGSSYTGPDPNGFMGKDEVATFFTTYAAQIRAPVRTGVTVTNLDENATRGWYSVQTTAGTFETRNVVIATGPYGIPAIPALSGTLPPHIVQVHSSAYRNPRQLPPGAVLVVGAGPSGFQIAEELVANGRSVYFSVGRHETRPRRYRGKDISWWLHQTGAMDRTVDQLSSNVKPRTAALTGVNGGHELSVRRLADQGASLLGHIESVDGAKLCLAPDLAQTVREAEERGRAVTMAIDGFIARTGIDALAPPVPDVWPDPKEFDAPPMELDLQQGGVTTVVWATRFRCAFDWVHLPVVDVKGQPQHCRGVTGCPGVYFLGLPWLHKLKSSFIIGVGEDAAFLAEHIVAGSDPGTHGPL
jgi:putative flavoprotein involved in K+ transport